MSEKKTAELTKHETDVLLGLYSGCECLWNVHAPDYNQSHAKLSSLRSIVSGMRLETGKEITTDQVTAKIRTLRHIYKQELKKVLHSQVEGSNDVYHSQWRWFNFLDSFLRNHIFGKDGDQDPLVEDPLEKADEDHDNFIEEDTSHDNSVKDSTESFINALVSEATSTVTSLLSTAKTREKLSVPQQQRESQNQHSFSLRSRDRKSRPSYAEIAGVLSTKSGEGGEEEYSARLSASKKRRHTRVAAAVLDTNNTPVLESEVSQSIANTLYLMQTLMAKTLSAQDHPSFVFAKHLSNELDLITDYKKRKQCMLEIHEVVYKYQTQDTETFAIKNERESRVNDADLVDGVEYSMGRTSVKSNRVVLGKKDSLRKAPSGFQAEQDNTPVHFEILEGIKDGNV